ncbi:MAG: M20/M25/M40 family metallo-hydrolase [Christensenellales bacterium]
MQYNEKLDAELKALEGDMIETLQRWIRVPSVRAERSAENAPFGADVRRALDTAMADLKRLGMEPRDVDGYCCDTEIGEGDEVIAVLSHLDVVPEGEGWDHDPYGAEIIDGRMIGRGTSDDKGPGVAAVFAMKAILNAGIPLRRRCRLILGCDENAACRISNIMSRKSACRIGASLRTRISRLSTPKRAASSWRCTRRSTTRG